VRAGDQLHDREPEAGPVSTAGAVCAAEPVERTREKSGRQPRPLVADVEIDVAEARHARRAFAVGCLDWTERRVHLGGALGAAVLRRLLDAGHARLEAGTRVVRMKPGAAWMS
jgi:hypothetical protein